MTEPTPTFGKLTVSLNPRDATAAIEFYKKAFGAKVEGLVKGDDGTVYHAELSIGSNRLYLSEEMPAAGSAGPATIGGTCVTLSVEVDEVDAASRQAEAAGATILSAPKDEMWGERVAILSDPFGYRWSLTKTVEEVTYEEVNRRMREMMDGDQPSA